MVKLTDILVLKEHELERISGIKTDSDEGIDKGANSLIERGIKLILGTLGEKGVIMLDVDGKRIFPANKVKVLDTTVAGDSFLGGFLASYIKGADVSKSISDGQLVAAHSVQKLGAQSSMPNMQQLEEYIVTICRNKSKV